VTRKFEAADSVDQLIPKANNPGGITKERTKQTSGSTQSGWFGKNNPNGGRTATTKPKPTEKKGKNAITHVNEAIESTA